jgi:hypothetical protein
MAQFIRISALAWLALVAVPAYADPRAELAQARHDLDVSEQVQPTMGRWRDNIARNREQIEKELSEQSIEDFLKATELIDELFRRGIWGYALIRAIRGRARLQLFAELIRMCPARSISHRKGTTPDLSQSWLGWEMRYPICSSPDVPWARLVAATVDRFTRAVGPSASAARRGGWPNVYLGRLSRRSTTSLIKD